MEAKVVSSVDRSNRISKDHYKRVQSSLSKKRVHHAINESIFGISKEINHLVSKSIIDIELHVAKKCLRKVQNVDNI